jgi:hypothetical protein
MTTMLWIDLDFIIFACSLISFTSIVAIGDPSTGSS